MGYATDGLTFHALTGASMARLCQFRDKHGELCHSQPDGSDWSPEQWFEAVVGELGEYANWHKKFMRGDISLDEFAVQAAKELADVQTYLAILAKRCLDVQGEAHPTGIDLGQATIDKFNDVSDRVGSTVYLEADGWHHRDHREKPSEITDIGENDVESLKF